MGTGCTLYALMSEFKVCYLTTMSERIAVCLHGGTVTGQGTYSSGHQFHSVSINRGKPEQAPHRRVQLGCGVYTSNRYTAIRHAINHL